VQSSLGQQFLQQQCLQVGPSTSNGVSVSGKAIRADAKSAVLGQELDRASTPVRGSGELADGLKVRRKDVLFGNPRRCSQPAEVDMKKAFAATVEGRKIKDDGIEEGSAQYRILVSKGLKRLKKVIRDVAVLEGKDCVIKKGCWRSNPDGLTISDLTSQVIDELK